MNDLHSNPKLLIVDYFDKLTNTIDIDTEVLIEKFYSCQEIKDKLNRLRLLYLNEVKRAELEYLKQLMPSSSSISTTTSTTNSNSKMNKNEEVETKEFKFRGNFLFYIEHVYLENFFNYKNGVLVALDFCLSDDEIVSVK